MNQKVTNGMAKYALDCVKQWWNSLIQSWKMQKGLQITYKLSTQKKITSITTKLERSSRKIDFEIQINSLNSNLCRKWTYSNVQSLNRCWSIVFFPSLAQTIEQQQFQWKMNCYLWHKHNNVRVFISFVLVSNKIVNINSTRKRFKRPENSCTYFYELFLDWTKEKNELNLLYF